MARPDRPTAAPTPLWRPGSRCSACWTLPGGDRTAQALLRGPVGAQALPPPGRGDSLERRLPWPPRRRGGCPRKRSALASTPHLLLFLLFLLLLASSLPRRSPGGGSSWGAPLWRPPRGTSRRVPFPLGGSSPAPGWKGLL